MIACSLFGDGLRNLSEFVEGIGDTYHCLRDLFLRLDEYLFISPRSGEERVRCLLVRADFDVEDGRPAGDLGAEASKAVTSCPPRIGGVGLTVRSVW